MHYKSAIISIAKDENAFLDEWYNWHMNLGFDHIFIIDNNDLSCPLTFDRENCTIIRKNGLDIGTNICIQPEWYNEIYENYVVNDYDYMITLDIDEFLDLDSTYKNISEYIQYICENTWAHISEIRWKTYDDNEIIYEKDLPSQSVVCSYPQEQSGISKYNLIVYEQKSLVKCYPEATPLFGPDIMIPAQRWYDEGFYVPYQWATRARIRHYRTKCTETYIKHKYKQQKFEWNPLWGNDNWVYMYFSINHITTEKVNAFMNICNELSIPVKQQTKNILLHCAVQPNPNEHLYEHIYWDKWDAVILHEVDE